MNGPPLYVRDQNRSWTKNLLPGTKVYGERLRRMQGQEYRAWNARRSKLAAFMEKTQRPLDTQGVETVLYLGAASGTTVSHLSDLLPQGRIVAVEFSPRPFRDLLHLAAARPNILPVLSDAHQPEAYEALLDRPADMVVQDIAQRDQVLIFTRNVKRLLAPKGWAYLAVKARSIDVARPPRRIYDEVRQQLQREGFEVSAPTELEPFEKDHALFVVTG